MVPGENGKRGHEQVAVTRRLKETPKSSASTVDTPVIETGFSSPLSRVRTRSGDGTVYKKLVNFYINSSRICGFSRCRVWRRFGRKPSEAVGRTSGKDPTPSPDPVRRKGVLGRGWGGCGPRESRPRAKD